MLAGRMSILLFVAVAVAAADEGPAQAGPPGVTVRYDKAGEYADVSEGGMPVLRYTHGSTPLPEGISTEESRHGDYISRLYGLDGELLTEDYPKDHPHHRAVNWSWATIRWNGETRDLFWGKGIWARPVGMIRAESGPETGIIEAGSVWKWDDAVTIVEERVIISVHREQTDGRAIDIEVFLTPIVEGLEFCGRLEAGYSGFNVRMAPADEQQIRLFTDPPGASPRRAWADYSAAFPGGRGRSGLAILQRVGNKGYPHPWREYPSLNFFQPIYPGGALIPMPKVRSIALRYRLWVHRGAPSEEDMAALWDACNPPAEPVPSQNPESAR